MSILLSCWVVLLQTEVSINCGFNVRLVDSHHQLILGRHLWRLQTTRLEHRVGLSDSVAGIARRPES